MMRIKTFREAGAYLNGTVPLGRARRPAALGEDRLQPRTGKGTP